MKRSKTKVERQFDNKNRMAEFRDKMKGKGFKSVTVFLSQGFIDELKRLGDSQRLSRAEAMEKIFKGYLENRDKKHTRTLQEPCNDAGLDMDAHILLSKLRDDVESLQDDVAALKSEKSSEPEVPEEAPEKPTPPVKPKPIVKSEKPKPIKRNAVTPPEKYPNKQNEIPFEDEPTPADIIKQYRDDGMAWEKIANKLNADNVPTRSGRGKWYGATVKNELSKS